MLFKKTKSTIRDIDNFLDTVDQGILVFKEGVKNYLEEDEESFLKNLEKLYKLESKADTIVLKIQNEFFEHSLIPQFSADVVNLLDHLDDIIDTAKKNLFQFDEEKPDIPKKFNVDFSKLTDVSCAAAEAVISAVRSFFNNPSSIKDTEHRVFYYEKEADILASDLKRKIFETKKITQLSRKIHLRYFTLHIEQISDKAEEAARILSALSIKTKD
jgi:predicted phosphate transport protein (TIGR00153 family)